MPDYDQRVVLDAWHSNLISKDEAREALGFHDDDLATEVIDLQVKLVQSAELLANALRSLDAEKEHASAEWRRGHREGYVEGYRDKLAGRANKLPLPARNRPAWYGTPEPWPGQTFTVNTAGEATVSTAP